MNYTLSTYQTAISNAYRNMFGSQAIGMKPRKSNKAIIAVAGSGKSFTIKHVLNNDVPKDVPTAAIAFNTDIARALEPALPGRTVKTYHALGLWGIRRGGVNPKIDGKKSYMILKTFLDRYHWGGLYSAIVRLTGLVKNNLIMDPNDTALMDLAINHGLDLGEDWEVAFNATRRLLHESINMTDIIDFDDMVSFHAYHPWVSLPTFTLLAVDEYQDTNNAQEQMVYKVVGSDGVIMAVGDPNQCQPAGTLVSMEGGGVTPIENLRVGDSVVSFDRHAHAFVGRKTQGRKVLAVAKRLYTGNMFQISAGGNHTFCTSDHKWMVRYNTRSTDLNVVYLMRKGEDFRVGWCQLFQSGNTNHLSLRSRLENADDTWILSVHYDKEQASITESIIAANYGLSTLPFHPVNGAAYITADNIRYVFSQVQNQREKAERLLTDYNRDINFPIYQRGLYKRNGRTTVFITHACNLIPEIMSVPVYTGCKKADWQPISLAISSVNDLPVFSLKIETHEMYVADGILTHNCIYAFRGANTESFNHFIENFRAEIMPLSITYRNPTSVVRYVNDHFSDIQFEPHENAIEGEIKHQMLDDVSFKPGDMILCRMNAPLVPVAFSLIRRGIKVAIRGRDIGENLKSLINRMKADDLGDLLWKLTQYRDSEVYKLTLAEKELAAQAVDDKVETINAIADSCHTIEDLLARIDTIFSNDAQPITLSTVHKAKGLEADDVYILGPVESHRAKSPEDMQQEKNIHYVAVTRAKKTLTFIQPRL